MESKVWQKPTPDKGNQNGMSVLSSEDQVKVNEMTEKVKAVLQDINAILDNIVVPQCRRKLRFTLSSMLASSNFEGISEEKDSIILTYKLYKPAEFSINDISGLAQAILGGTDGLDFYPTFVFKNSVSEVVDTNIYPIAKALDAMPASSITLHFERSAQVPGQNLEMFISVSFTFKD